MRLSEFIHSVRYGIQERELYSHLDITDPVVRQTIAEARREIKKVDTITYKELCKYRDSLPRKIRKKENDAYYKRKNKRWYS